MLLVTCILGFGLPIMSFGLFVYALVTEPR